jgi:hypothetical protein
MLNGMSLGVVRQLGWRNGTFEIRAQTRCFGLR